MQYLLPVEFYLQIPTELQISTMNNEQRIENRAKGWNEEIEGEEVDR